MTIVGRWALHLEGGLDEADRHWVALTAAGMVGAAERDGRAAVYFAERVADLDVPGRWEHVEDRDWHAAWRAGLAPVRAGCWVVTPSWHATGHADELVIDPGQAFGTGHHETTVGCLEALGAVALPDRAVLDVGTGTGVLAIAAARGGAAVTAVDVDPLAVAAAEANARRNGATVEVLRGGVERVDGRRFDVVVANLDTATLVGLADVLAALLAPAGLLIASGVSNERADEARSALAAAGLVVEVHRGVEWALVRAGRVAA